MTLRGWARPRTNGDLKADGLGGHGGVNHGGLEEYTKKQEIFTGCQGILRKAGQTGVSPAPPHYSPDEAWLKSPTERYCDQGPKNVTEVSYLPL